MKKWLFIAVIVFTLLDAFFTYSGVKLNFVEEANPLFADAFISSPFIGALKSMFVSFTGLLILFLARKKIRWINHALVLLFIVKLGILALHANWIIQYAKI